MLGTFSMLFSLLIIHILLSLSHVVGVSFVFICFSLIITGNK